LTTTEAETKRKYFRPDGTIVLVICSYSDGHELDKKMKYFGYIMVLLYWNMLITYLREALNAIANVLKGNNFLYPRFENYDNF